jgi:hypothetical protein
MLQRLVCVGLGAALLGFSAVPASAQTDGNADLAVQAPPPHDHAAATAPPGRRWEFAWDGVLFTTFNHQGGRRGARDVRAQNWLMLMASRPLGPGSVSLRGMVSAEPLTVGAAGYAHLFQLGETYRALPVTDRQHPHDLLMQLEARWTVLLGQAELSLSGGPVGSPAFGPVAFPHRLSASENPAAPLTHHTFDSTHIAMGTVTGGVRWGSVMLEGSLFRGLEPDEHRYDLESGALDSRAGRLTWRPGRGFEFQLSRAHVHQPERLEPGNQKRTNGSISWAHRRPDGSLTAISLMAGRVSRTYTWTGAVVAEGVHWIGKQAVYGRFEGTGIETEHLLFPTFVHPPHPGEFVDSLHALTMGGVRRIMSSGGIDAVVGGDVTLYRVPARLRPTHGERPTSLHVFVRIRPLRAAATQHQH